MCIPVAPRPHSFSWAFYLLKSCLHCVNGETSPQGHQRDRQRSITGATWGIFSPILQPWPSARRIGRWHRQPLPRHHPEEPDRSSRRFRSYFNTSLCFGGGWDVGFQLKSLHSYIRLLPTQADFEHCVTRIEKTYGQEISELKKDKGVHIENIENTTDGLCSALQSHEKILNAHTVMQQELSY